jgi:hypothetical protein
VFRYTLIQETPCSVCEGRSEWVQAVHGKKFKPSILFPSEEEMNKLVNNYYGDNEYGDGQKDAFKNGWQLYKRRIKELNNL